MPAILLGLALAVVPASAATAAATDACTGGARASVLPTIAGGSRVPDATGQQYGILTPKPPAEPRINGARVFGVRPGRPFLYTIAATGERPMTFEARGLPAGLTLDQVTGRITGVGPPAGEYLVTLIARNSLGRAERVLRIVAGDRICLTPPMGWNSWNSWAESVDEVKVRQAAESMVSSGLQQHGWTYINIDDGWQGRRTPPEYALQPKQRMGDMKALADFVHGLGLKLGIYSTPWKTSYAGFAGGSADTDDGRVVQKGHVFGPVAFHEADARQFAAWGVDYLKYDWNPIDLEHASLMAEALRRCGRDIVFSLSNSAPLEHAADWARIANAWRTTGDLDDNWQSVSAVGFAQDPWRPFAGPGHWNDPDMLVVGRVGWGPALRPTALTPNEQYTHVTLWCLLAAPLLVGCDLAELDEFTLGLLTNDEVIEVNQDPLGRQAARLSVAGQTEVWAKEMQDGSHAVGLFNRGDSPAPVAVEWATLGIRGPRRVRDLWRQKDLGEFGAGFQANVLAHGVVLVRVLPPAVR